MLVLSALQLARLRWSDVAIAAADPARPRRRWCIGCPALRAMGHWNLVVFFVGLLVLCVLSGVPIGFSFGLATFSYLATTTSAPLSIVVSRMDEGMSSLILLAVPLFVLLGALIEMTGMAAAMVGFLVALLGHVRGGLNYVLAGRHVPHLRHLRLQGGGHGGGGARAVPRDETPRHRRGGRWSPCSPPPGR